MDRLDFIWSYPQYLIAYTDIIINVILAIKRLKHAVMHFYSFRLHHRYTNQSAVLNIQGIYIAFLEYIQGVTAV